MLIFFVRARRQAARLGVLRDVVVAGQGGDLGGVDETIAVFQQQLQEAGVKPGVLVA